jgi:hypothetical protein
VHGGQHQVAGLGGLERDVHRLVVAQLTDEDDVGVLAERRAQGSGEVDGVEPHLALGDRGALAAVEELDGVLHGEDVHRLGLVDVVDDRGQGGRLARAGRAGDEDQAPVRSCWPASARRG